MSGSPRLRDQVSLLLVFEVLGTHRGGIKLYGTEGVTLGEFKRVVDVGYVATLEADGKAYVLSPMLQ